MGGVRALVVAVAVAVAAVAVPSAAVAQPDPADSISLAAPTGHIYADYPFTFSGAGSVDGADADDYAVEVLFTPSSSPILRSGCPSDFTATAEAIEQAYGGPDAIAEFSQEGLTTPVLLEQGGYTWSATVNGDVVPTVTAAGSYFACAYLGDELTDDAYAVSSPVPFTVTDAPGTGAAPTGFGGPRGSREPSDVGLKVVSRHTPVLAPGRNLLRISGSYDATDGPAGLVVTLNQTKRHNGCAANDEQDLQITGADQGAVLTDFESVSPSSAGNFTSPVAMNFRRHVSGTLVVCAYLRDGLGDDLSVGYLRFTAHRPKTKPRTHRHRGR